VQTTAQSNLALGEVQGVLISKIQFVWRWYRSELYNVYTTIKYLHSFLRFHFFNIIPQTIGVKITPLNSHRHFINLSRHKFEDMETTEALHIDW